MRVQKQIDQLLTQRAAEWKDTLSSGGHAQHEAFLNWLCQSKLHVQHYLEVESLDAQVRSLDKARGPDVDALLAEVAPAIRDLDRQPRRAATARSSRWTWRIAAAVSGIAILSGVALLWQQGHLSPAERVSTAIGEQRILTLPDGSVVRMNVDTTVRLDYGTTHRTVELVAGEALFKVAQDTARPFIVRTSSAQVRALGTEFNVYRRDSHPLVVSVIEGRVQVTTGPASTQNLAAGEEAQVTQHHIEKRQRPDVQRAIAWRERRLYFDDTPLEQMVQEFNRYGGPVLFKTDGIDPGAFPFAGTFNADDPESFINVLEEQHDLQVERHTGTVLIRRKPER